jgi:UDP-N-acetylglucosamine 2-epimerase (non-hydrolysing)
LKPIKIISVVGARPNFMKVAPLHRVLQADPRFESIIVHTGQHYDAALSDVFFRQLGLPEPHEYLGVGSGSHAVQTAAVMTRFEEVVERVRPDLVIVVGDVNSTLACSVVAAKCHIPVAHVEAGLRSRDRTMPEEINRMVTDSISDYFFVTEDSGVVNLKAEGVAEDRIFFVGNLMIDSLVAFREAARLTNVLESLGLREGEYVVTTFHRPSNVDSEESIGELVRVLESISRLRPLVFPVHPRTRSSLERYGHGGLLGSDGNLRLIDPIGYLEFLRLVDGSALVLTDSGGIQEETTYLGIPCLTLRENTERPVTIDVGTNELMPLDAARVSDRVEAILRGEGKKGTVPPLWDGRAAERIRDAIIGIMAEDAG